MQLAASVVRPDAANYFIEVFYRISFSFVTAFRFAKSPTFRFPHYICEKIFLHIRKFPSAYTQGNRCIYAHLSPPFQLYDEAPLPSLRQT